MLEADKQRYDELVAGGHTQENHLHLRLYETLLDHIQTKYQPNNLCHIACGTGALLEVCWKRGIKAEGIDTNAYSFLHYAKRNPKLLEYFLCADPLTVNFSGADVTCAFGYFSTLNGGELNSLIFNLASGTKILLVHEYSPRAAMEIHEQLAYLQFELIDTIDLPAEGTMVFRSKTFKPTVQELPEVDFGDVFDWALEVSHDPEAQPKKL